MAQRERARKDASLAVAFDSVNEPSVLPDREKTRYAERIVPGGMKSGANGNAAWNTALVGFPGRRRDCGDLSNVSTVEGR
jgi:hypothetical protein